MKFIWSTIEREARQHMMELPDGLWQLAVGGPILCKCVCCDRTMEWEGLVEEWEEYGDNMAYCGGSPRCCP